MQFPDRAAFNALTDLVVIQRYNCKGVRSGLEDLEKIHELVRKERFWSEGINRVRTMPSFPHMCVSCTDRLERIDRPTKSSLPMTSLQKTSNNRLTPVKWLYLNVKTPKMILVRRHRTRDRRKDGGILEKRSVSRLLSAKCVKLNANMRPMQHELAWH